MPAQTTFNPKKTVKWTNGKIFTVGVLNRTDNPSSCNVRLVDSAGNASDWRRFQNVPGHEGKYEAIGFNDADTSTGAIQVEITLENPPGNPPADLTFTIEPLEKAGN